MSYGDFGEDMTGGMSASELTRNVKNLWKAHEETRNDVKVLSAEITSQGKTLTKIDGNIDRLANAIMMVPPKDQCIKNTMQIQMLKESVEELEDKGQCHGCKNEKELSDIKRWKEETAPRIYMAIGGLGLLQVLVPIVILLWKK